MFPNHPNQWNGRYIQTNYGVQPIPTPMPGMMPGLTRTLTNHETKDSIDAWFNQTKAMIRTIPAYQRYMDLTWKAYSESVTRGFVNSATDANLTKEVQAV